MERAKSLEERERALIEIALALSSESNLTALLERIVGEAKRLTSADGGSLYSVRDGMLYFEIVRTDSLNYYLGGVTGKAVAFPPIPLLLDEELNDRQMVTYAVNYNQTLNIADAYEEKGFNFTRTRDFDQKTGYRTRAVLTVPIRNQEKEVVAVLQLINPKDPDVFTEGDVELCESFASLAGVALTNRHLIYDLRHLLYSLMKVIAEAIDEKSPSTLGHEKRVPQIALLLAEAVNKMNHGPLQGVHFTTEEMEELRLAAYLHDCGKISTPQHIVEKKTKLEGIYDRCELIELRFQLAMQNASLEERRKLEEDLAYIKECNVGITDDPKRIEEMELLTEDEKHHLSVKKGTLTEEERRIVEKHVEKTYSMLSQLSYPKDLRRVPEIAASHHERMDGKGYPRGLKGKEIPLRGRLLAIADVFEALSAPDRPYKKPWKLSKVLKVMQEMTEEGHFDPALFDVFVQQKVYLEYAKEHLSFEQNDIVKGQ